jgi:hypothetical protein
LWKGSVASRCRQKPQFNPFLYRTRQISAKRTPLGEIARAPFCLDLAGIVEKKWKKGQISEKNGGVFKPIGRWATGVRHRVDGQESSGATRQRSRRGSREEGWPKRRLARFPNDFASAQLPVWIKFPQIFKIALASKCTSA